MDNNLLSILKSDLSRNISILGFFSNYDVEEYFIEKSSALIFGYSDQLWAHISSSSVSELSSLLKKYHTKTKYYYSVEDWMISLILKHGKEDWRMITNRYTLEQNVFTESPKFKIATIDKSYANCIYNNSDYKSYISLEYIEERLRKDISAGIFVNDNLVAWGFTHDDGALGFLHVLKDFRKNGYGAEILLALIRMRKKVKKPIYVNIVHDNVAATNLVTKLGFKLDCRTSWIKLK